MFELSLHIRLVGLSLLGLALSHIYFAKRFQWLAEARRMSRLNEQIFHVHSFFICLVLVMMGLINLLAPEALLQPSLLGRWIDSGFALFWLTRLYCQWFVYDPVLWRGKLLETLVHIVFTLIWCYYMGVYGSAAWEQFHS